MKAWPLFTAAMLLFAGALGRDAVDRWINTTMLPPILAERSVEMRDRHGALLRAYTVENGRWRLNVTTEAVDPLYLDMLIAIEDRRFHSHPGVDLRALLRAAAQAARHGRVVSGGSTLTMQVARLLENSGTGRMPGKLRQIRLALALERRLGKTDILDLYLLHAPFGGNLEGVRAASLAYFGKEPTRLSPAEAALLVALPQAPEARRPDRFPNAARDARDRVLEQVRARGGLDRALAAQARSRDVPRHRNPMPQLAAHLTDRARLAFPARQHHELSLDGNLQARLERLVRETTREAGRALSAALVVADHRTGDILASVGSPGADAPAGHVDMTRALRSPGSTLKPLVYALAFGSGRAHPLTIIEDAPIRIGPYAPANFDGSYRGDVTLDEALRLSLNTPVVRLTQEIGPARLIARLEQAGVSAELDGGAPGLAVALGGVGVRLEELVTLYAGLAQGGIARPLRMTRDGPARARPRFVSELAAWQVSDALFRVTPPAGAPAGLLAFKTGTSYGHRDAWAIGFDGAHVIGVWMGRPDGTSVPGVFGADLAAPLMFAAAQMVKPAPVPLRAAPRDAAHWRGATLPAHLRRFGAPRGTDKALALAFPPDGARLAARDVTVRIAAGEPPFSLLLNDVPVQLGLRQREMSLRLPGAGFHILAVVDARGQADRVRLRLD